MTKLSPREIEHKVQQLADEGEGTSVTTTDISVSWGEAAPEERPHGIAFDPEDGTLRYDLWGAQQDAIAALNDGHDVVALMTGYGGGKSVAGARWLLRQALEYGGSRFLLLGKSFNEAKKATYRILFEQLPGERTGIVNKGFNGPEQSPIVRSYDKTTHTLTLANDSVIRLGSATKWNRLAGDSFGAAVLDEPAQYEADLHELLEMVGSRFRGESGPQQQFWTLTGKGQNSAYDILERQVDANGDELGLSIKVVRASTLNNPYLSEGEIERYKRQYAGTAREQQALHGGFQTTSGALLKRDQLQFIHEDEIPSGEFRYHVGVDLSYLTGREAVAKDSDSTAFAYLAVDSEGKQAYLLAVETKRGLTLREGVEYLAEQCSDLPNPIVKVEDVGGQKYWIQEARQRVPARIQAISPGTDSKESRLADMAVLFERGDCVIVNQDVDENLGYDPSWQQFIREWCQVGQSDNSPDRLDACWYSLQNARLRQESATIVGANPYGGGGNAWGSSGDEWRKMRR